jgi:hypothetical protein
VSLTILNSIKKGLVAVVFRFNFRVAEFGDETSPCHTEPSKTKSTSTDILRSTEFTLERREGLR